MASKSVGVRIVREVDGLFDAWQVRVISLLTNKSSSTAVFKSLHQEALFSKRYLYKTVLFRRTAASNESLYWITLFVWKMRHDQAQQEIFKICLSFFPGKSSSWKKRGKENTQACFQAYFTEWCIFPIWLSAPYQHAKPEPSPMWLSVSCVSRHTANKTNSF